MDRALALSALDAEINMLMDMRVGDRLVTTPRRFRLYVQQVLTFLTMHGPTCKVAFLEHLTHPLTKNNRAFRARQRSEKQRTKQQGRVLKILLQTVRIGSGMNYKITNTDTAYFKITNAQNTHGS